MIRSGEAVLYTEEITPIINPLECPYCPKSFPKKTSLNSHLATCKKKAPLISVIIPSRVGEKNITLQYLKKQTYKNFEVIVEIDKKKEGANVCRNRGAQKAKGEYLLFSDNDIEWQPHALSVLYKTLLKNPQASYSYCSYTLEGELIGHEEFSPANLRSYNYISTMSLIKKADFPGFDEKIKKYQDWDLWLTLLEKGKTGVFCGQTLFETKHRKGITFGGEIDSETARNIILKKHSPANILRKPTKKAADIIIPHHDRHDLLYKTLQHLDIYKYNIIIVSGGSFADNCNQGAKIAKTDNLIFMNDDIEPKQEVLDLMTKSDADIVGAAQITPSWHKSKIFYGLAYEKKGGTIKETFSDIKEKTTIPVGFLLRFKKDVWEELGGFDERFKNGGEDQDIALRAIEKGFSLAIVTIPTIHYHSQSEGRFNHTRDNRALLDKLYPKERLAKILARKNLTFIPQ